MSQSDSVQFDFGSLAQTILNSPEEVVQNVTEIQGLKGERRLLD